MMNFCLFVHFKRYISLVCGLALLVLIAPSTLAENAPEVKVDAKTVHIALILPLNPNPFRQAAEIVKQGFLVAAKQQTDAPPVRIYPTSDDPQNILSIYQQALDNGAAIVAGPLTKNAVMALGESDLIKVPTLALSVPDSDIVASNLYLFGLSLDVETRQIAQFMQREKRQSALVISTSNTLGKRLQATFVEAWQRQGGSIAGQLVITPTTELTRLQEQMAKFPKADAVFLAMNAQDANMIRPYLFTKLPSYATSQVFSGNTTSKSVDLDGVRFLDMPWLLQPDHPAVMVFTRSEKPLTADSERLYGLGIDAFRLALLMYQKKLPASGPVLDGVTGQITLNPNQQFSRELTPAEFQTNVVVVLDNAQP